MFGAASIPSLKEPEKPEQPTPRKSPYVPLPLASLMMMMMTTTFSRHPAANLPTQAKSNPLPISLVTKKEICSKKSPSIARSHCESDR